MIFRSWPSIFRILPLIVLLLATFLLFQLSRIYTMFSRWCSSGGKLWLTIKLNDSRNSSTNVKCSTIIVIVITDRLFVALMPLNGSIINRSPSASTAANNNQIPAISWSSWNNLFDFTSKATQETTNFYFSIIEFRYYLIKRTGISSWSLPTLDHHPSPPPDRQYSDHV